MRIHFTECRLTFATFNQRKKKKKKIARCEVRANCCSERYDIVGCERVYYTYRFFLNILIAFYSLDGIGFVTRTERNDDAVKSAVIVARGNVTWRRWNPQPLTQQQYMTKR